MKNTQVGQLLVKVTLLNATEGYKFNVIQPGDEYGPYESVRDIYRDMKSEYGGHVTKMYRDREGKPPIHCGWVFRSRQEYTDSREKYVREVWVEVVRVTKLPSKGEVETVAVS